VSVCHSAISLRMLLGFLCDSTGKGRKEKVLWKEIRKDQLKGEIKPLSLEWTADSSKL